MLFLRLTARPLVCNTALPSKRSLASTIFLTRSWQNEPFARLRQEAKARGLSVKGNKATLIMRLEQRDNAKTVYAITTHSVMGGARNVSSVTPGIPQAVQPLAPNKSKGAFLSTQLPDLSQLDAEPPIQIPYVPDFWDSSPPLVNRVEQEAPLPKLLVVAGDTHLGGGPSHNLLDIENTPSEGASNFAKVVKPRQGGSGLWDDIVEDVGLPPVKDIKKSIQELFS